MRAVEKGVAPKIYTKYQDAQADLIGKIGAYCSYCEMPIVNMPSIEHVISLFRGGSQLDWENFLLACWHCNGIANKGVVNLSRVGYLWPDRDNTHLAFIYSQFIPKVTVNPQVITSVSVNPRLTNAQVLAAAQNTIDLVGLDKYPSAGASKEPTEKDLRWLYRFEAWRMAQTSLQNWHKKPNTAMAHQIGMTAKFCGFYSVWTTVFQNEPDVIPEIERHFIGTYNLVDAAGLPIRRAQGFI
jgi:hypothetical protein